MGQVIRRQRHAVVSIMAKAGRDSMFGTNAPMSNLTAPFDLTGKVALITGASKGLGKAMAMALSRAGASIALVSRDELKLAEVHSEIAAHGASEIFVADVRQESQVIRLEKEVAARFGKIQILINNAGINIRKNLTDFTLDEWQSVMDTNLTSVFLMCRAFVPHMKGGGYGRILSMTSIMSHISLPQRAAYSASKTGVLGIIRALALELAADGITVNGISPGPFATEMNLPVLQNPEANAQFLTSIPMGKWGKVEDIGSLALFLCSDAAGFITGTDILIDGGWCAR
jgi:NAD(P)-dependent dehydrogenase (short-subunit alcohol dehydrogenase family)